MLTMVARPPEQSTTSPDDVVEIRSVSKRYGRGARVTSVFEDLSLDIRRGSFTTVVGPSGCGKSTLLNLLGGFEAPTEGRIVFEGAEVSAPAPDRLMVFQGAPAALFPWLSAGRNVEFGVSQAHRKWPAAQRKEATRRALTLVGLWEHRGKTPAQLSGGMQQRLQLARALAIDPGVLLMDEPFGALDAQTRETLSAELVRIWQGTQPRKTIVFITHDIDEAIRLGTRVVVMAPEKGIVGDFDAERFGFDDGIEQAGYGELRSTVRELLGRGAL